MNNENRSALSVAAKELKKGLLFLLGSICVTVGLIFLSWYVIVPTAQYYTCVSLMKLEQYKMAIEGFEALDGYLDSENKIAECEAGICALQYAQAEALLTSGDAAAAYEIFLSLEDYSDSAARAEETWILLAFENMQDAKVGDFVVFGTFEQDNDSSNGSEAIEWRVLAVEDGRVLLLSRYALDVQPFNDTDDSVTWETCTLRDWLNSDFFSEAFSETEQAHIATTTVTADENLGYNISAGNDVQDKVFLLSSGETLEYLPESNDRLCVPTAYTLSRSRGLQDDRVCWWLRTPGRDLEKASCVAESGGLRSLGNSVDSTQTAVRPAIWVDLGD